MWRRWLPLILALAALALYLRTMVPGVYVSDFAEFQYQPVRLGLPHPNGFPLYMALGWLISHLPVENVAWRMNLLSALGGALAVGVTSGFALRVSRRASVALLAGGLLALLPVFWFYSLAAERYTLNLALLAGAMWAAWEAGKHGGEDQGTQPSRERPRLAWLSAFLLGLGLAMHPSDALLVPFWLFYIAWRLRDARRHARFWLGLAACGVLPLLLYAYVPWRWAAFSGWPLAPGIGRSQAIYQGMTQVWYTPGVQWEPVWRYITGLGGYATGLLGGGWREAFRILPETAPDWAANIAWWLLIPAAIGALWLARSDWPLAVALGGFALLESLMVAYIGQGKNQAYLLPAFWAVLFFLGFALDALLEGIARLATVRHPKSGDVEQRRKAVLLKAGCRVDAIATGIVALLLLALLARGYGARDLSREVETANWWQTILAHPIEQGAGLLGQWSDMTPLWYAQQVDGQRPDLLGLFPPDQEQVIGPWMATGRPLYLAAPLGEWAPDLPQRYSLVPWGRLVRILPRGERAACPAQSRPLETPPQWPFAATSWEADEPLVGGQPGTLRFCWEARVSLPKDTFLTLELHSDRGGPPIRIVEPLVSQWYPAKAVSAGTSGLAAIPVRLPAGTPPGTYFATLVPYRLHEEGGVERWPGVEPVQMGEVTVEADRGFRRSLLTNENAPLVAPRAGPLVLRAWHLSRVSVRPGDPIQLDLLWEVAERPSAPVTLSVNFWDGVRRVSAPPQAAVGDLPIEAWEPGMLLRSSAVVRAPRGRGDGTYVVEPRLSVGDRPVSWLPTLRLPLGTIQVKDRAHVEVLPEGITRADAAFGDVAQLEGYDVETSSARPGGTLPVTLYWRAGAETQTPYWVFLHLEDSQGNLVAQHDSAPANGDLPTNIWVPGEVIADRHEVALPAELPAGTYTLRVGLYQPDTFERLPITTSLPNVDRAVELTEVGIGP